MRFMLLLSRGGAAPAASTADYDDALRRAGILLARAHLDGRGAACVQFGAHGAERVEATPSTAAATLASCWTIQARSPDEAIEWARRCPAGAGDTVEVRRLQDAGVP